MSELHPHDLGPRGLAEPLTAALAASDRAAVARALRDGPVVVPHLTREDGTPQVRVFPAPEGSTAPYQACLFTTAAALADFLHDDPGREFSLRRRDSLIPFLRRHGAALAQVVLDPAGPHPMTFEIPELVAALDTEPSGEDERNDPTGLFDTTGAGISPEGREALASVDEPGGSRGVGIELNLPDHWVILDLEDPAARDEQIRDVVKQQTAHLSDRGASLRRDLRTQMADVAEQATTAGGQVMAYLVLPGDNAALALNVTLYWHDLGPQVDGVPHLDRIETRLRPRPGRSADEPLVAGGTRQPPAVLTRTQTLSGPFLRHVRHTHGAPQTGGQDTPLLLVDYWAEAPGGHAVTRLAFTTPHADIAEKILTLTDKVLFATEWILAPADALVDAT